MIDNNHKQMKNSGYKNARNEYFFWCTKMIFDLITLIAIIYLLFYGVKIDPSSAYMLRYIISGSIIAIFYVHAITYQSFADSKTKYKFYKYLMDVYKFNLENYDEIIEHIQKFRYESQEYKSDVMGILSSNNEDEFFTIAEKIYKNIQDGVYEDEIRFIYKLIESISYITKYIDRDFLKKTYLKR